MTVKIVELPDTRRTTCANCRTTMDYSANDDVEKVVVQGRYLSCPQDLVTLYVIKCPRCEVFTAI